MDYTHLRMTLFSLTLSLLCLIAAGEVINQPCSFLVNPIHHPSPRIDCSRLNLHRIPTNLNGANVARLDLSHNQMMYLNASDLQTFNTLLWLDLSWNNLRYLNDDSFIYVGSTLTFLDLSHNRFLALPDNSFVPLQNVLTLLLAYPGIPREQVVPPLGPGFQNVTQLRNLSLTGIYIEDFNATFLHNLVPTNLKIANFSFNTFARTENDTFLGFHSLQHLTMRHVSELTEPALSRLMLSLNNSSLKILELGGNDGLRGLRTTTFSGLTNAPLDYLEVSFTGVRFIEDYTFRPVGNLTQLKLDGMQLYSVSLYAFQGLHKIHSLDLEQNNLTDIDRCLNNLTTLRHLILDMNPLQQIGSETFYGLHSLNYLTLSSTRVSHLPNNTFMHLRKLQNLNMNWLENHELTIEPNAFQGCSDVRIFRMKKAGIRNFTAYHVRPMAKLEHISLDYNVLTGLDPQIFKPVNSTLRVISLIQSNITAEMLEDGLLQDLPYLNTTWLCENGLRHIPNDTFKGYASLYLIDLQDNRFPHIPEAVKLVHTMRILNIYNNSIQKVRHDLYDDLGYLNSSQLYEYMGGNNPYNCSCHDDIPFIEWFNETNITTDDRTFYRCSWPEQVKNDELYKFNRALCDRHEPPNYLGLEIALPATVVVVVALTLGLLYRYRLKIKWLWFLRRLAYYRKLEEEDDQEYEFDALVSYGERGDDYKFVLTKMMPMLEQPEDDVEKLKLAVEFRDIPAGDDKAEVLIEFIEKSRKIVLLISKLSVQNQDDWLWFVYRQAAFRAPGRKNLIIIILLEPDVQKERNLPIPLQHDLKKRLYIAWPGDNAREGEKDLFWKQLREALKYKRIIPMTNMFP